MIKTKTEKTVDTVRERERERAKVQKKQALLVMDKNQIIQIK